VRHIDADGYANEYRLAVTHCKCHNDADIHADGNSYSNAYAY
jgi:hypothetical protein